MAASSFENISRGLQLLFLLQVFRRSTSVSVKMTFTPSTDRTEAEQGKPLPVNERAFARCRLSKDVASILIYYERDPSTAIELMLADMAALSTRSDEWAKKYAAKVHHLSLERAKSLREKSSFSAMRKEIDEVAPELDKVFEDILNICTGSHMITQRPIRLSFSEHSAAV